MPEKLKWILGIAIGIIATIGIYCLTVAIGCAVNGLTFGQQITSWFGSAMPAVENTTQAVGTVAETIAHVSGM